MIIFCSCSFNKLLDNNLLEKLVGAAENADEEFDIVDDLCRIVDKEPERFKKMDGATVVACYPRAVKSLFDKAGCSLKETINIRKGVVDGDTEEWHKNIAASLGLSLGSDTSEIELLKPVGDWIPWYPVIDYDRCIHCGRCMDYCLFGVYAIEDGRIKVVNSDHCKNNCPACSRVCPEKAIIFPKYPKSFINGGMIDEEPSVDIEELLKKRDLYKQLQARNQNRNKLV
jgi:Pyruvate/2-oxoacid:ferredoxin oxidoreductase delta subunit